jgi:hypothetical protein
MTTGVSPPEPTLDRDRPGTEYPTPLRTVHAPNVPTPSRPPGVSLRVTVTTNRAGQLVPVRDEADPVTLRPGRRCPEPINDDERPLANSFVVPDAPPADGSTVLRPTTANGCVQSSTKL